MAQPETIGRLSSRSQSASGPPTQDFVSVAVLPPRLPPGMAPRTGVGAADVFSWDEAINWQHNEAIEDPDNPARKKSFMQKVGLTGQRKKANEELPPFILKKVPYDVWRKHYAKDKDGNFRGTHTPAEDCLLKPEDVKKWRFDAPVTKGDKWTRGSEALPGYTEVLDGSVVPDYDTVFNNNSVGDPTEKPSNANANERQNSSATSGSYDGPAPAFANPPSEAGLNASQQSPSNKIIAEGKTAQEIIAEAKAKGKQKMTWKEKLRKGAEGTMGGG